MTDELLRLAAEYGALLVFLAALLSCLAVPVPSAPIMLAAGAFIASGDLHGPSVVLAAFAGAVIGDQIGYFLGHRLGTRLWDMLTLRPKAGPLLQRAEDKLLSHDVQAVFLSRWLFSPLGPFVNFTGGAMQMNWRRFTLAAVVGEAIWVGLYIGLGYIFAARIEELGNTLGNLLAALGCAVGHGPAWVASFGVRTRGLSRLAIGTCSRHISPHDQACFPFFWPSAMRC